MATPCPPSDRHALYQVNFLDADSILLESGKITWIGKYADFKGAPVSKRIDLEGRGVTPGLIDFHAHPVFASTREDEFELRTRGASYAEIAQAGGGILNSVKKLRNTEEAQLIASSLPYLQAAMIHGTTTMEAKSGYGLSPDAEVKMLEVIRELDLQQPVDLIPTFLGAHEFPPEYREDHEGYINLLVNEMIPMVAARNLAAACDIFCETGVFSVEEARRVLTAAKENGLQTKVHADQLTPLGGAKLAAELGSLSADHIEFITDEGVDALAESGTVAGLLPVAAHFLRMTQDPPVRTMIEKGVVCALATDFNPGSAMSPNMQMALHLGVIRFRITAEEALWMATAGSARALGLVDRGWIGEGAKADLVVWNAKSLKQLPYYFGVNLAHQVYINGQLVVEDNRITV